MTWFRCGGGSGMPADLKNRMNAVFNKKFGTAVDYPSEGWPDDVNLMGPLPEKTIVSSPIADFSDGADDVPTKAVKISIPPTLSGVSEVTETQTGKNLAHFENTKGIDTNGNIYVDSKRCATVDFIPIKSGVSYKAYTENNRSFIIAVFNGDTLVRRTAGIRSGSTLDVSGGDKFRLCIYGASDVVCTVEDDKPRCYLSTETDTTYESYQTPTQYTADLGRTIYGGEVDIVNGTGTDENGNDFTFTGQEINTRLGYNAFWSDSGDTEVTYRADISLALQAVSGSRGLMMTRPAIEPANGDQGSEESTENNIETEGEQDAR